MPINREKRSDQFGTVYPFILAGEQLDLTDYLMSFELERVSHASSMGQLVLFDREWDRLENIFLRAGALAPVQLRYGFYAHESKMLNMHLGHYTPSFSHSGVTLTIDLVDSGTKSNLTTRSDSWPAGTPISDIVKQLCQRNKWEFVIEPTLPSPEPILQNELPDNQFITTVLHPLAVSATGTSGYIAALEPGEGSATKDTFHFHTPGYVQSTKGKIARTYNFARDTDGEMIDFQPSDMQIMSGVMGGRATKYEQMDYTKGEVDTVTASAQGSSSSSVVGGKKQDEVPTETYHRYNMRPFRTVEERNRFAQQRQTWFANLQFQATATVLGDPFIYPQDVIVVNVIKDDGSLHERWSGKYLVKKVTQKIDSGGFTTTLDLQRRAAGAGGEPVNGKAVTLTGAKTTDATDAASNATKTVSKKIKGAKDK